MQVDSQPLSEDLVSKVEATQEKLSKTRRKRAVPEDWATADDVQAFKPQKLSDPLYPGARSVAIDTSGDLVLCGGADGVAGAFSKSQKKVLHVLKGGSGAITHAIWNGTRAIIATSAGVIKIFDNGAEIAKFSRHAGEATALAIHPSGDILASVGTDKSLILYDLSSSTVATQIHTESALTTAAFHPDGHLFAAGGVDGQIRIYDVKSGAAAAANFETSGPIQSLAFSENGTWLAVAVKGEISVQIWDLRKAAQIKAVEIGTEIESVRWDYTGQFLLVAGPSGLAIQQYSKSTKEWTEPLRNGTPSVYAEWGPRAQSFVSLGPDGSLLELTAA